MGCRKAGIWPSGDRCLAIAAEWMPRWPLAKVHADGNREAKGAQPRQLGTLARARLVLREAGVLDETGLTSLRQVPVEVGRGGRANGKKLLPRARSEVRVEAAGAPRGQIGEFVASVGSFIIKTGANGSGEAGSPDNLLIQRRRYHSSQRQKRRKACISFCPLLPSSSFSTLHFFFYLSAAKMPAKVIPPTALLFECPGCLILSAA